LPVKIALFINFSNSKRGSSARTFGEHEAQGARNKGKSQKINSTMETGASSPGWFPGLTIPTYSPLREWSQLFPTKLPSSSVPVLEEANSPASFPRTEWKATDRLRSIQIRNSKGGLGSRKKRLTAESAENTEKQ